MPIVAIQIEGVPHRVQERFMRTATLIDVLLEFYLSDLSVLPDQLIDFEDLCFEIFV